MRSVALGAGEELHQRQRAGRIESEDGSCGAGWSSLSGSIEAAIGALRDGPPRTRAFATGIEAVQRRVGPRWVQPEDGTKTPRAASPRCSVDAPVRALDR